MKPEDFRNISKHNNKKYYRVDTTYFEPVLITATVIGMKFLFNDGGEKILIDLVQQPHIDFFNGKEIDYNTFISEFTDDYQDACNRLNIELENRIKELNDKKL